MISRYNATSPVLKTTTHSKDSEVRWTESIFAVSTNRGDVRVEIAGSARRETRSMVKFGKGLGKEVWRGEWSELVRSCELIS